MCVLFLRGGLAMFRAFLIFSGGGGRANCAGAPSQGFSIPRHLAAATPWPSSSAERGAPISPCILAPWSQVRGVHLAWTLCT